MKVIRKIWHGIIFIFTNVLFFVSFPLAFLIYGRKKIWLISEVDFDARDNGLHLFTYLRKEHPEINVVYLISKKNPNYRTVSELGKTVKPHSYKHMLMFIAAKAKISTLVLGCSPSWALNRYLLKHHCTGKNIALKHGIFKNLHPNYFKQNAHLDLICCGAKPEYDFIKDNFGYSDGVAQYTGLARFDGLQNIKPEKEILIMPTWRRWLDKVGNEEEFAKSEFFQQWYKLLNNENFAKIVKDNEISVVFYVHPKLNKYVELFKKANPNVTFLNSKSGDSVQAHLKSSAITITDFSSIFFDIAYMKKPAIYFQFDEEQYYGSHYKKAYFDYRENGFGPVCVNTEEVVNSLNSIVNNNLEIEPVYLKRAEEFFPLHDGNNCSRIYDAIMEVLKK